MPKSHGEGVESQTPPDTGGMASTLPEEHSVPSKGGPFLVLQK